MNNYIFYWFLLDPQETIKKLKFTDKSSYVVHADRYVAYLTHLRQMDSSATTLWTGLFPIAGCLVTYFRSLCFTEIFVFNANNVDPD